MPIVLICDFVKGKITKKHYSKTPRWIVKYRKDLEYSTTTSFSIREELRMNLDLVKNQNLDLEKLLKEFKHCLETEQKTPPFLPSPIEKLICYVRCLDSLARKLVEPSPSPGYEHYFKFRIDALWNGTRVQFTKPIEIIQSGHTHLEVAVYPPQKQSSSSPQIGGADE